MHVGLAVFERRPRTGEELRSRPQQDRQGQQRHRRPDDVERRGTLLGYAGEQLGIGEVDDGKRHNGSEPELPHQGAIQPLAGSDLGVTPRFVVLLLLLLLLLLLRRNRRVAGSGDDLGEHFVRHIPDVDDRLLGSQVDPCPDDPGSGRQSMLDGGHASGTGHPFDGEPDATIRFPGLVAVAVGAESCTLT